MRIDVTVRYKPGEYGHARSVHQGILAEIGQDITVTRERLIMDPGYSFGDVVAQYGRAFTHLATLAKLRLGRQVIKVLDLPVGLRKISDG